MHHFITSSNTLGDGSWKYNEAINGFFRNILANVYKIYPNDSRISRFITDSIVVRFDYKEIVNAKQQVKIPGFAPNPFSIILYDVTSC